MSLKTYIEDSGGSGNKARVSREKALFVSDLRLPPEDIEIPIRPFRSYFLNNGSFDMRVVGSTASPIDFVIEAAEDADRFVDSISFVISDGQAVLNKFGNITSLSVGTEIFYEDSVLGDVVIADSLTSNFDFVRLTGGSPIGNTTNAYRASNVEGSSEGYICRLDFSDQFGMPWGIRLPRKSKLRLVIRIKDDTTGVDAHNAIAYGFDRVFL